MWLRALERWLLLVENLNYDKTVAWDKAVQKVRKPEKRVSRLQVEDRTVQDVPQDSEGNKCSGITKSCFACGQEYHFKGA